jgi:hypothetical protein
MSPRLAVMIEAVQEHLDGALSLCQQVGLEETRYNQPRVL